MSLNSIKVKNIAPGRNTNKTYGHKYSNKLKDWCKKYNLPILSDYNNSIYTQNDDLTLSIRRRKSGEGEDLGTYRLSVVHKNANLCIDIDANFDYYCSYDERNGLKEFWNYTPEEYVEKIRSAMDAIDLHYTIQTEMFNKKYILTMYNICNKWGLERVKDTLHDYRFKDSKDGLFNNPKYGYEFILHNNDSYEENVMVLYLKRIGCWNYDNKIKVKCDEDWFSIIDDYITNDIKK